MSETAKKAHRNNEDNDMAVSKSSKATVPTRIAVDDGYAYTKVAWFDEQEKKIKTFAIPSAAKPGNHVPISMEDAEENPVDRMYTTDEGILFTAGNLSEPESTESDGYPYSSLNRVIVNHALIRAGLATKDHVFEPELIGVTVPLNRFADNRKEVTALRKESLSKPVYPAGFEYPFVKLNPDAIRVFPEAIVAWADHLMDDEGNDRNDPEAITAIVDIGGRTTDITVFIDGEPKREYSGTYEVGILSVMRKIQRGIQARFNMASEPPMRVAERAVKNKGKISLSGQPQNVSDLIMSAKKEIADEIYRGIQKRMEKVVDFETMVFVGGGSEVLADVLEDYDLATVPDEPHLANARGVLKHLLYAGQ